MSLDTIISKKEMEYLQNKLGMGATSAEFMKNDMESLRSKMASMYSGEAYDDVQDALHKLQCQYLMIQQCYEALQKYVKNTQGTYQTEDEFTSERIKVGAQIAYNKKHPSTENVQDD